MAVVAKELGRRWEALTPDEKQTYKDKVQQAAEDQPDAEEAADAGGLAMFCRQLQSLMAV